MPNEPEGNESISQEALDALLADMNENGAEAAEEPAAATGAAEATSDSTETVELNSEAAAEPSGAPAAGDAAFDFATFQGPAQAGAHGDVFRGFERVQDIPLEITVELGRTRLLIRDVLELETGAIIELEKMAGEPVDLLANGLLVARGEVVVIEDNFGVRITEIITQAERKELTDWSEDRRAA